MQDIETREVIDRFWMAYDHLREINERGCKDFECKRKHGPYDKVPAGLP